MIGGMSWPPVDRGAGYRSHEAGTAHRDEARSAPVATGQNAGEIDDEFPAARLQQEGAEQDEHEHIRCRDVRNHAEHAIGAEKAAIEHGLGA